MFFRSQRSQAPAGVRDPAFAHLGDVCYMDSACQTPRAKPVLDAEQEYFLRHNACGGRVKYAWGKWVDDHVQETRKMLLDLAGKKEAEYAVAFTLNTTYGINLVLQQLPDAAYDRIVTSEIEHNSVLLPTLTWAQRHGKERLVLPRDEEGRLAYEPKQLEKAVVLVNDASNIDGRGLPNARDIARDVHAGGGILLIDGAQSFGHDPSALRGLDFDAAFGSGHKMYGPSIGFIIIRRTLLRSLTPFFLGGGTVKDVDRDSYTLLDGEEEQAVLEPGLQSWSGIVGLHAGLAWFTGKDPHAHEAPLAEKLFARVSAMPKVHVVNSAPRSLLSFHVDGLDAHRIALYMDAQNVMCRTGHFCCHYYLQHVRKLPPLVRASLGLHSTAADVERFCATLESVLKTI